MQKINSADSLNDAIRELETRQAIEEQAVKEQFHLVYESVKPINLIKSTFKQAIASEPIRQGVLNASIELTAGYVATVLFRGILNTPAKKLVGAALIVGVTAVVVKNPDVTKLLAQHIFKMIKGNKPKEPHSGVHSPPIA